MKVKYLWVMMITLSFFGCDDSTGSLGLGMLPDQDKITTIDKTYDVTTNSILSDAVYARTDTAYLGKYSDSKFGDYNASFMSQLNCLDSLKFPEVYDPIKKTGEMVEDQTIETQLTLLYSKYFGDPFSPIHVNVFKLNKDIQESNEIHYTNIDVDNYVDRSDIKARLGDVTFSAADLGTDDEIKNSEDYYPSIVIPIRKEVGDDILRKNRTNPEYFYNNKAFIKNVFEGLYLEADQGNGSIAYVEQVVLSVKFRVYVLDEENNIRQTHDKKDSTVVGVMNFANTKEVFQLNRLITSPESVLEELAEEKNNTYIKSPAGIFTEVKLPIEDIMNDDEIKNDTIHSIKLKFETYLNDDNGYFTMNKPEKLLMIRKSEMTSFFEESKIPDNITSFIADLSKETGQYIYPNVSRLVNYLSAEKTNAKEGELAEDWDKMVLIPVTTEQRIESDYYGNRKVVIVKVRHNLKPEYARFLGGPDGDKLKMSAIFTSFNDPAFGSHK